MLKLFEVSGFKNFLSPIRIDFSDVKNYQFNENCICNNLLQKLIVYGKNASGKSNLGLALFDIVSHMTTNNVTPGLYNFYLNSESKLEFAEFRYVFVFTPFQIDYLYRKNGNQDLVYERVILNDDLLFECNYAEKRGNLSGLEKLIPTLNLNFRGSDSLLKYAITNSALPDNHPLYQMMSFISHMLWFRSLDENRYIGYKSRSSDYYDFIFEGDRIKKLEDFLHVAGVEENLVAKTTPEGKKKLYFDTPSPLPFFMVASSGTRALYTYFYFTETCPDISLMFIDEFDAYYHYELSETIVKLIEKMPHCQAILTSHNTNLLSNRIMRPDCYFILSDGRLTSFANATKRELRAGHNLEKLYMSGEFDV